MLQQFVDPAAIAAQIKRVQGCTAAALASTVRPAGPGAPHPGPVAADDGASGIQPIDLTPM